MSPVHEFVLCTIMQENTISGGVNKTQNIDCPLSGTVGKLLPNIQVWLSWDFWLVIETLWVSAPWELKMLPVCSSLGSYKVGNEKKRLWWCLVNLKAFNQCDFPWLTFALTHPYGWEPHFPGSGRVSIGAYVLLLCFHKHYKTISKKTFNRAPGAWTSRKLSWLQSTILQRTHSGPGGEHCLRSQGWRQRWDADTGLTTPALPPGCLFP